jgi:hypothetical protein
MTARLRLRSKRQKPLLVTVFRDMWMRHYVIADVPKKRCAVFNGLEAREERHSDTESYARWTASSTSPPWEPQDAQNLPCRRLHGNRAAHMFLPLPSRNKFLMSCLTFMKLDTRLCYCTSPRWNILKIYVYSGPNIDVECLRWHNITTHILQGDQGFIVSYQLTAYSKYEVLE